VVGCGSIGRRHLRNLAVLGSHRLLAYDPDPSRRSQAAGESGAVPVARFEEGVAEQPAAVLICSPTAFHAEQAIQAAEATDSFIEKPIAASLSEAERVRDAVERHKRKCLVACNLRFHPGIRALKDALDRGDAGRALAIRVEFGQYLPDWHPREDYRQGYSARTSLGGGVVRDEVHELDLVRWLVGDFEQVRALKGRAGELEIETEDVGLLIGRTNSGTWCEVHVDYLQRVPERGCKVIGSEGTLQWDDRGKRTTLSLPGRDQLVLSEFSGWDSNEMYVDEVRHFLKVLDGDAEPEQTAEDACLLMQTVERFEWI